MIDIASLSDRCPPQCAVIERIGWDDDGRFTATLVFPNGPPDIPFLIVWRQLPVRIVPDDSTQSDPDQETAAPVPRSSAKPGQAMIRDEAAIERIAAAIYLTSERDWVGDDDPPPWEGANSAGKDFARLIAKAAIKAIAEHPPAAVERAVILRLREPTEAMLQAISPFKGPIKSKPHQEAQSWSRRECAGILRAMLDGRLVELDREKGSG